MTLTPGNAPASIARLAVVAATTVLTGCGAAVVDVGDGSYVALVPTAEQFDTAAGSTLPGGFAMLAEAGIGSVELVISGDEVAVWLDGSSSGVHPIGERREIEDSEGSGPFRAKKQMLLLDGELVLGDLIIAEPAIWAGSFDASPVITVKAFRPGERGPQVSCDTDDVCLLLTSSRDPEGTYADANDPQRSENPIHEITVTTDSIKFLLDNGTSFVLDRPDHESTTRACGTAETRLWEVPEALDLGLVDPVVAESICPSHPGAAIQLIVMPRTEIPTLVPFGEASSEAWCQASASCLWFAPE